MLLFKTKKNYFFLSRLVFCGCYLRTISTKKTCFLLFHPCWEPSELYWFPVSPKPRMSAWVGSSLHGVRPRGDGHSRWCLAWHWSPTPLLPHQHHHPPTPSAPPSLSSQQWFHISQGRINNFSQALAGDNATQLNRWCHNYIWYCTVITCHLSTRMCEKQFCNYSELFYCYPAHTSLISGGVAFSWFCVVQKIYYIILNILYYIKLCYTRLRRLVSSEEKSVIIFFF